MAGTRSCSTRPSTAGDGDFRSIRRLADRDHANIASWNQLPGLTGHYIAYTNPDRLAADVRRFFRPLRSTAIPATTGTTAATKES